jgi:hypothetical protein
MKKPTWLLLSLLCSGCVHMRSISTTSIPVERDNAVESTGYRFLFLMINFKNDYVNEMTKDLAGQCPDGRVEGILTKQEDIMYFPLFAHAVRVSATGYCVKPGAPETDPSTLVGNPGDAQLRTTDEPEPTTTEPAADEAKK